MRRRLVGSADGSALGELVGIAVGGMVGIADGSAVGSAEGSAVGGTDGTGVGYVRRLDYHVTSSLPPLAPARSRSQSPLKSATSTDMTDSASESTGWNSHDVPVLRADVQRA